MRIKVAAVIRNNKQETLLIKEKYTEEIGFKWNLVKGTYDDASETIEDCIKREINEEVGLKDLSSVSLNKIFHYDGSKMLFVFNVFYTGSENPTTNNNKQDEAISEIKWFSKTDLSNLKKEECMAEYVFSSVKESSEKVSIIKL